MKTLPTLALVAVLAAAGAAQAQSRPAPTPASQAPEPAELTATAIAAWRAAQVKSDDYFHAFDWEDHARYVRPVRGYKATDPQLRFWVREEFFKLHMDDDGAHRSNLSLVALDCPLGRFRTLTSDAFPELNLQGEPRTSDVQNPEWTYPRPESVEEQMLYYGCVLLKQAGKERR